MRGSSTNNQAESGGASTALEMLGRTGQKDSTGKSQQTRKYFVSEADLSKVPAVQNFVPTSMSFQNIGPGYEQTVNYTSAQVELLDGTEGAQPVKGTFAFLSSYETRKIIRHPKITLLKRKYGGREETPGTIYFPEFLPQGTGIGQNRVKNPMYGVTSYREYSFIFRHSYVTESVTSLFAKAGNIVTRLPGGISGPPGEKDSDGKRIPRRWLTLMANMNKSGRFWSVEQDYLLLDAAGVADDVYEKGSD